MVFQSRYSGTYEGGEWFALGNCTEIPEGPWNDDDECVEWFSSNERTIGIGDTPDDAVSDLLAKDEMAQNKKRILNGEYRIAKSQGEETIY